VLKQIGCLQSGKLQPTDGKARPAFCGKEDKVQLSPKLRVKRPNNCANCQHALWSEERDAKNQPVKVIACFADGIRKPVADQSKPPADCWWNTAEENAKPKPVRVDK
jgi:hypothetical protein